MASSGNFPVLNTLYRGQRGTSSSFYSTASQGNTRFHATDQQDCLLISTIENLKTGKWYWEFCLMDNNSDRMANTGVADSRRDKWDYTVNSDVYGTGTSSKSVHFFTYNQIMRKNGSDTGAYSSSASSHSVGDVFGFALDTDNGKAYAHKNGTYYASGNPATGANPGATWTVATEFTDGFTPYFTNSGGYDGDGILNFGQDSTFGGAKSAGGNADENGFGDFQYAPPTGFLAVCSANLPISADIDVAQTDTDGPHQQFNTILYTGNAGTLNVTGLGFQPDLVWLKRKTATATYSNALVDSSRGRSKVSWSSRTASEATSSSTQDLKSFDSDGFTLGVNENADVNGSGDTYVAWAWKANGGTTASNTQGATNSVTQANTKAGFSIVTYTGIAGANGSSTVGHGLTQAPEFILHISRTRGAGRWVQHMATSGSSYVLQMHSSAETDYSSYGTIASPTATTFGINGIDGIGGESADYVAYVWHSVAGASKFGKYTGNGNNDGIFIYTGFRVAMIAFKRVDGGSEPWTVFDNKRATYNPTSAHSYSQVYWDMTSGASSGSTHAIDFLSNGVKLRGNGGANNTSGGIYAYCAWGDVSFKYNNTF
jgi:hypothetical protein